MGEYREGSQKKANIKGEQVCQSLRGEEKYEKGRYPISIGIILNFLLLISGLFL
jgi:hypothetical protein